MGKFHNVADGPDEAPLEGTEQCQGNGECEDSRRAFLQLALLHRASAIGNGQWRPQHAFEPSSSRANGDASSNSDVHVE